MDRDSNNDLNAFKGLKHSFTISSASKNNTIVFLNNLSIVSLLSLSSFNVLTSSNPIILLKPTTSDAKIVVFSIHFVNVK